MKLTILAATALAIIVPALAAQNPLPAERPMGADTPPMWRQAMRPSAPGQRGDPAQMERLRQQVEERWGRMVQQELQLNDQQMDRVRAATRPHQDRRRDLGRRRMDLERGIQGQMQPGVAANQDSLSRMLDAMGHLRVEDAQSDEQLNRDLNFLTPVQRARFFMMSRRFEERLREIRERRMGGEPMPMMQRPEPGPDDQRPPAPRPPEDEDDSGF